MADDVIDRAAEVGASPNDLDLIASFQSRIGDFTAARDDLQRLGAAVAATTDNELWAEYGSLVDRADTLQSTIQGALDAIDSAIAYARKALGLDGVRQLSGLGFVWLIPAAIIVAAIAALGYWLTDYGKLAAKLNAQQRISQQLVAAGVDPAEANRQATDTVAQSEPTGLVQNLTTLAKYALGIGVAWWLWSEWSRRR